jgi:hypothetical protein
MNKRVMLGVLEKPHRNRCCEVCCSPFPMRLAHVGVDPGVRPLQPYRGPRPIKFLNKAVRTETSDPGRSFLKRLCSQKTPLIATCTNERRSGFELQTPSPASTLDIATRSSARACCKQRAGFKDYFINSWTEEARPLPTVTSSVSARYRHGAGRG